MNPRAKSCFALVQLYGRDGTPIRALWNVFDPIEYDTDCHGYTLTGGQFFIQ